MYVLLILNFVSDPREYFSSMNILHSLYIPLQLKPSKRSSFFLCILYIWALFMHLFSFTKSDLTAEEIMILNFEIFIFQFQLSVIFHYFENCFDGSFFDFFLIFCEKLWELPRSLTSQGRCLRLILLCKRLYHKDVTAVISCSLLQRFLLVAVKSRFQTSEALLLIQHKMYFTQSDQLGQK